MNLQDDPGAVFRKAMPEATPPPDRFDLDAIVRDGYRVRRRHRAVLGGAATTGVAAVAAVLALSVGGLPTDGPAEDPTHPPAAGQDQDPAMSGYPYVPDDAFGDEETTDLLQDAAMAAFGPLFTAAGLEPAGAGSSDLLDFTPVQKPGNYGQVWLRSYVAWVSPAGVDEDPFLNIEAMLPGGWTGEPGPITEQLFPQHIVSASGDPWHQDADWEDELTTTDLDDGRTLITVDHECAVEAAVVYPNGSGLRAWWDMGCGQGSPEHAISVDDFAATVQDMPEVAYDTADLAPVEELIEVPTGWLHDAGWESDPATADMASASIEAAAQALRDLYPGSALETFGGEQIGGVHRGAVVTRAYHGQGSLPITVENGEGGVDDARFDLRYHLPGGWLPGIAEDGARGPYLATCDEGWTCSSTTDDDGTAWAFEERSVEAAEEVGADLTRRELRVTRFDAEGWAVSIEIEWVGDAPIDADVLADVLRTAPAPVYDESAPPVPDR